MTLKTYKCAHCFEDFLRGHVKDTRGKRRSKRVFCSPKCRQYGARSEFRWLNEMVNNARKGARARPKVSQMDNTLTSAEARAIWSLQEGKCAVTHHPLDPRDPNPLLRPSLDRTNSEVGYTKENARFVCRGYNSLKGVYADEVVFGALTILMKALDIKAAKT
jgi:hypothetical protein